MCPTKHIMNSKKAQGMSLKVVMVAVIAIVVLIVLIVIFTGRTKIFSQATASCEAKGGACQKDPCSIDQVRHLASDCAKRGDGDKPYCCGSLDRSAPTPDPEPTQPETPAEPPTPAE